MRVVLPIAAMGLDDDDIASLELCATDPTKDIMQTPDPTAQVGSPTVSGRISLTLRGYPETFSHYRNEIKQPPCGNETRGDRRERVCSAYDVYD